MSVPEIVIEAPAPLVVEVSAVGTPGAGVPVGGTTGQVLAKASDDDRDTEWVTGGGGGGTGPAGASAYEVAVAEGFVGDEAAWLASLVGATGATGPEGPQGPQGDPGATGPQGDPGAAGADGDDGASAYEVAVAEGFVGDETAWLASLVGDTGPQGPQGDTGATGPQGDPGATGAAGADLTFAVATTQSGTTYTVDAGDNASTVICTNASAVAVTIPTGLTVGYRVLIASAGAAGLSLTTTGNTLIGSSPNVAIAQNEGIYVEVTASNTLLVLGGTA